MAITDSKWRRALDDIETTKDKWLSYNPLFRSYTSQFHETFDRGIPMNLDYYVTRDIGDGNTFEEELCSLLFSTHGNPAGKVFVLEGGVGSGKTCLVRYFTHAILPKVLPGALAIRIDAWNMFYKEGEEKETLEAAFLEALENAVLNGIQQLFSNQKDYYTAVLTKLGYKKLTDKQVFDLGRRLSVSDVVKFLLDLPQVTHLLVIIDNIDESSNAAIMQGHIFALALARLCRQNSIKPTSVLITLREYISNRFFDTEKFAYAKLPSIDEVGVVTRRLEQLRDIITSISKDFKYQISYTRYVESIKQYQAQTLNITVTKKNTYSFLKDLTGDLLSSKETAVLTLLRELSAGNMKILIGNFYNLLQSVKLPLLPLFERVFIPKTALELRNSRTLIPLDLVIECLLAIHYPFYDVGASNLINIFNTVSSTTPNDFQNILIIPRILYTLSNNRGMPYEVLKRKFEDWGYSKSYLEQGLDKCLGHGLIHISSGNEFKHIALDTTISPTSSAKCYLDLLIFEPSYLQYVCEDTPMPAELRVPIIDKYHSVASTGNKKLRLQGVEKLISLIERAEILERNQVVVQNQFAENAFLAEASLLQNGKSVWMNQALKDKTLPRLEQIG